MKLALSFLVCSAAIATASRRDAAATAAPTSGVEMAKKDHVAPTPLSALSFTHLGDIVPAISSVGWGSYQVDRRWYESGFKIAGEVFDNGVYAHAPSDVHYHLERKYSWLTGCVGLNDQNDGKPCGDGVDFSVIVSGKVQWTKHKKGGEKVSCFKVDVREAETLQLVANHLRDQNCDESEWVNMKLYEDPVIDCMQLGQLVPDFKSVGWGSYWVNKNWYMNGFMIDGVRYQHGVFAHADSHLIYPIKKKFHTFQACVGLDDGGGDCGDGVTFAVYADAKRIYAKDKAGGEGASCFHLDVTGVQSLQLVVDKKEDNKCDEAEWVNANLCTVQEQNKVNCVTEPWGDWSTCSRSCGNGFQERSRGIKTQPRHGGARCGALQENRLCAIQHCPVDCKESEWTKWGPCSLTCGGGTQHRYRSVDVQPAFKGKACGDLQQSQPCGTIACPIDCMMGDWGEYSTCKNDNGAEVTCGGGWKVRTREQLVAPANGGRPCGTATDRVVCNTHPCKQDCERSSFSEWSTCSRDCGTGYQTRSRKVLKAADHGGKPCTNMLETKTCNTQNCPVDCIVDYHAPWGECSKTCGGGSQARNLTVIRPALYGGQACPETHVTRECSKGACPTDCVMKKFGPWSECSKTCGTGYSDRTRIALVNATNGGRTCPHRYEIRQCNTHWCPVDCSVSDFGPWQPCTKTCGGGTTSQHRTVITQNKFGGKECPHEEMTQSKACAEDVCPIDCELSMWAKWSDCTVSCGGGSRTRSRAVTEVAQHGGKGCGVLRQVMPCAATKCPVDCEVDTWGPWTTCTKECELGTQMRIRGKLEDPQHGGKKCPPLKEHRYCNTHICPLDCKQSDWGSWKPCDKSCGDGQSKRYRHTNVQPKGSGAACGASSEAEPCNEGKCPINCEVGPWSGYGDCDVGCGGGTKERTRSVTVQPDHGGRPCPATSQTKLCNNHHCPIHCQVTDFQNWGKCSRTCGSGIQIRKRSVTREAMFGGDSCGEMTTEVTCNETPCPVDCEMEPWSPWNECSKSCEMGFQNRTRGVRVQPKNGGKTCGEVSEMRFCNNHFCPTDCVINDWGGWTECGKTCGGGVKARSRTVATHPSNGGAACPALSEEEACNEKKCPVDCVPTYWGTYTHCSAECGTGHRTRQRFVDIEAQEGGTPCGHLTETTSCEAGPCPVHCIVDSWQNWGDCSKTCGTGSRTRIRAIKQQNNEKGTVCPALSETDQCEVYPCPVDCDLGRYEPWSECTASCGNGTQTRVRPVLHAAQLGGKCPATRQSRNCNTHACALHKYLTGTEPTPAPTPFDVTDALNNDNKVHAKQANGNATALGQAAPTQAPTQQVLEHENYKACLVGSNTRPSGWMGAGSGKDYCNLCKCFDGVLSCQKKNCGKLNVGKKCSHVECDMVYSYAAKKMIMLVKHHSSEHHGAEHKCVNNVDTNTCTCHCFGKANTIWTPFKAASK